MKSMGQWEEWDENECIGGWNEIRHSGFVCRCSCRQTRKTSRWCSTCFDREAKPERENNGEHVYRNMNADSGYSEFIMERLMKGYYTVHFEIFLCW